MLCWVCHVVVCRWVLSLFTIYETGLEARRPGLVVVVRFQVAARVETRLIRLRVRLRLRLRLWVEDDEDGL